MKRTRLATIVALLSLIALLSAAGPASAQDTIASHGLTADWGYMPSDDAEHPAGRCGYSAAHDDGFAYLRWIKVRAPVVAARDVSPDDDQQKVSWQVIIQRSTATAWKTIKRSTARVFTAYEFVPVTHDPIKVYFTATNDQNWRALIRINWLRNGSVEGWVKASITYYGVKWTVGDPAFVFTNSCEGRAD
jgi:hypothetical protein